MREVWNCMAVVIDPYVKSPRIDSGSVYPSVPLLNHVKRMTNDLNDPQTVAERFKQARTTSQHRMGYQMKDRPLLFNFWNRRIITGLEKALKVSPWSGVPPNGREI